MVASNPSAALSSLRLLFKSRDIALAIGLIVLVALMIIPLPAFMVDVLVVLNLALSLGVMLLTMYISPADGILGLPDLPVVGDPVPVGHQHLRQPPDPVEW